LRQNHGAGGSDGGELSLPRVSSGADEIEIGFEKWMKGDDHSFSTFDDDAYPLHY
jgi:hypothetical protein